MRICCPDCPYLIAYNNLYPYPHEKLTTQISLVKLLMKINKLTRISHTGGEAAVGADSSRPPPIYRPPRDDQTNLLNLIKS